MAVLSKVGAAAMASAATASAADGTGEGEEEEEMEGLEDDVDEERCGSRLENASSASSP